MDVKTCLMPVAVESVLPLGAGCAELPLATLPNLRSSQEVAAFTFGCPGVRRAAAAPAPAPPTFIFVFHVASPHHLLSLAGF